MDKVFTLEEKNNMCSHDKNMVDTCEKTCHANNLSEKICPDALKFDNYTEIIADNSEKNCPFSENILPFCSECRYLMMDDEGGTSCYKDGRRLKILNPNEVVCESFEKREFKGVN